MAAVVDGQRRRLVGGSLARALPMVGAMTVVGALAALLVVWPFLTFRPGALPTLTPLGLATALRSALGWILLAPVVVMLASRYRLTRTASADVWFVHALAALALPVAHGVIFALTGRTSGAGTLGSLMSSLDPILLLLGFMQYVLLLAFAHAMRYGRLYRDEGIRAARLDAARARLETQVAEARLQALRSQLQPHFLFNTLNSIEVLVYDDPDKAGMMLRRLSDLLRAVLTASAEAEEVALCEELAMLDAYLDLQQIRFENRLEVRREVSSTSLDVRVPTLVLQPLVENAIRHAVERQVSGGTIVVAARRENGTIVLEVRDSGPGGEASRVAAVAEPRGIGISNTRDRLAQLYGDKQALTFDTAPEGGLQVRMTFPARAVLT